MIGLINKKISIRIIKILIINYQKEKFLYKHFLMIGLINTIIKIGNLIIQNNILMMILMMLQKFSADFMIIRQKINFFPKKVKKKQRNK